MPVPEMFRIKICGLNDFENAIAVAHSGADAIGLNFFPKSKRRIDLTTAERIANFVRGEVQIVGLFVNASLEEITETHQKLGLDWIQLHGDETAELALSIYKETNVPIMAASRGRLHRWEKLPDGFQPHAQLMDAAVDGAYGGTGHLSDWELAATWRSDEQLQRFVLAGGLTPENVTEAISVVRPSAVDVAGGVEIAGQPGLKDMVKVEQFVSAAHRAFDAIT
ncbi:phosphoribosylanthranilate isomerase [Bremerella cremea]|uniref:phosphoribosylanthranilate isomerase n=1 Tax=Bremerella cremea TaxID=1031537 RepID=UPI0031EC4651